MRSIGYARTPVHWIHLNEAELAAQLRLSWETSLTEGYWHKVYRLVPSKILAGGFLPLRYDRS